MTEKSEATQVQVEGLVKKLDKLRSEIHKVIVGQEETVEQLIVAFIAGGHVLIEGVPGLAKTLMVRTLARAVNLSFKRIQFTPDLMPSDIIGTEILEETHNTKQFVFQKGPIFANLVLADEINRTPPKTQSALLEAMQEFEVTYFGKTHYLDRPFFLLATQNPIEQSGTFPLPEAQQDRFLFLIRIGYPNQEEEDHILKQTTGSSTADVQPVISGEEIIELQQWVRQVVISDELIHYVGQLVRNTRPADSVIPEIRDYVSWGAGPRAGQAIILTAKARALLNGRYSVIPEDLKQVAHPTLRHRILVNFKAEADGINSDDLINILLNKIEL
ncbi:AAA family ATPase [Fulvivirga sedimenti]|uniref:MoxR family ATPase n=1 Tax=Fulvivirga sedimenti TaxID=2879465 RepID=A0A9X1HV17_9BACT|nr:MoxR family ATPase [Fulvivirga sedimenti]MCA6078793.1 MoxR family ATPase [Fulvivirga sedimenti]